MQTEDKLPFETPFEWIGGESTVRALVDRFYDLMDLDPRYRELRASHGSTLDDARDKLFWFLCGWLGGPQHYQDRFGMDQAMTETGVDPVLHDRLNQSFFQTADWMRNRGGA